MRYFLPFILPLMAFLVGSIPFGLLLARAKGVDIKKTGSGNIGATNVLRSVGKVPALLTLIGDIAKGGIMVLACRLLGIASPFDGVVALCAVLGHDFSLFMKFKGGKGVATSLGVLLVYSPYVGAVTIAVWMVMALIFRYSSLAALTAFTVLPLNMYLIDYSLDKTLTAIALTVLIAIKHRDNITRLLKGTETRIGNKDR